MTATYAGVTGYAGSTSVIRDLTVPAGYREVTRAPVTNAEGAARRPHPRRPAKLSALPGAAFGRLPARLPANRAAAVG